MPRESAQSPTAAGIPPSRGRRASLPRLARRGSTRRPRRKRSYDAVYWSAGAGRAEERLRRRIFRRDGHVHAPERGSVRSELASHGHGIGRTGHRAPKLRHGPSQPLLAPCPRRPTAWPPPTTASSSARRPSPGSDVAPFRANPKVAASNPARPTGKPLWRAKSAGRRASVSVPKSPSGNENSPKTLPRRDCGRSWSERVGRPPRVVR